MQVLLQGLLCAIATAVNLKLLAVRATTQVGVEEALAWPRKARG